MTCGESILISMNALVLYWNALNRYPAWSDGKMSYNSITADDDDDEILSEVDTFAPFLE